MDIPAAWAGWLWGIRASEKVQREESAVGLGGAKCVKLSLAEANGPQHSTRTDSWCF
ncbi:hypothetical protein GCM10027034_37400 [Ramlibacter solisilvae]